MFSSICFHKFMCKNNIISYFPTWDKTSMCITNDRSNDSFDSCSQDLRDCLIEDITTSNWSEFSHCIGASCLGDKCNGCAINGSTHFTSRKELFHCCASLSLIIGQTFLNKYPSKPSTPGALSSPMDHKLSAISFSVISVHNIIYWLCVSLGPFYRVILLTAGSVCAAVPIKPL